METSDLPRAIYLIVLLVAVVGWFIAENRAKMGQTLRTFLVWGMIFIGLMAGYGLWGDIRNEILPRQTVLEDGTGIMVPRAEDGHFHLELRVNDVLVPFLVDTGASDVVLTLADARRVGLDTDDLAFIGRAQTANGMVSTAYATLESVALGQYEFQSVDVAVNGGDMSGSLLGMSFLSRFGRIEISGNRLLLEP